MAGHDAYAYAGDLNTSSPMVHTETTSAKDAGLRGAQVKTEVEADQSASMPAETETKEFNTSVIIIIAVIVGFALLGAIVLTLRMYSDCISAKDAVKAHFAEGAAAAKPKSGASATFASGDAREVHVEVVAETVDEDGRLQAGISCWTQHTCPESGDVYFYSDPDLGGTGATAWQIPQQGQT